MRETEFSFQSEIGDERTYGSTESRSNTLMQYEASANIGSIDATTFDPFLINFAWLWIASYSSGFDSNSGKDLNVLWSVAVMVRIDEFSSYGAVHILRHAIAWNFRVT